MVKDRRQDGYDQVVMRPGDPWPWATCDGDLHCQAEFLWSRTISWIGHYTPWLAVRRIRHLTMLPSIIWDSHQFPAKVGEEREKNKRK